MASIFRNHDSPAVIINRFEDHVHVFASLSRTISIAKLMEEVKGGSSKWIKSKDKYFNNFYWQSGYAALGVGYFNIDRLKMYIINQKVHHKRKTFKEEYIEYLEKYWIEYDERYIWD